MTNPYNVVIEFEEAVAKYCGSKYAVAVESCTSALFLSMVYEFKKYKHTPIVYMPSRTYPGVACSVIHAGGVIKFENKSWEGEYQLYPHPIWDAALRFKKGMYHGGFQCLSFHIKKLIPIGRGGMILTDDFEAVKWLRKARFDGRDPVPLQEDNFTMLGWNMYMQPDQAARGLQLLQALGDRELPDLEVEKQGYPDLSKFSVYGGEIDNGSIKVGDVYESYLGLRYKVYAVNYEAKTVSIEGPGHNKKLSFDILELDFKKINQ